MLSNGTKISFQVDAGTLGSDARAVPPRPKLSPATSRPPESKAASLGTLIGSP
jgi:hypothetical protein